MMAGDEPLRTITVLIGADLLARANIGPGRRRRMEQPADLCRPAVYIASLASGEELGKYIEVCIIARRADGGLEGQCLDVLQSPGFDRDGWFQVPILAVGDIIIAIDPGRREMIGKFPAHEGVAGEAGLADEDTVAQHLVARVQISAPGAGHG